ncbi:MAG: DUF488 domain-containing protein [Chloroflexi bacterium]|nr:DUF488 domain-containing protein [Chloroflexota bacterium]
MAPTVDTIHPDNDRATQLPLPWPFSPGPAPKDPDNEAAALLTIFTIGHSNHDAETFLALLRQYQLEILVDVRSAPYSRYAPHFSRRVLSAFLDDAGIRYVWAGSTLGGRPDDPTCYRDGVVRKGNVDYRAMSRQASYKQGVQQLMESAVDGPIVVMCSEEDPRRCHRHHLLEHSLRDRGVSVVHIRRDGILETIEPAETAPSESSIAQLVLLEID